MNHLRSLQRRSHKADWTLASEITEEGARIIVLSKDTNWEDLIVRAEVRADARVLSNAIKCPIEIIDSNSKHLDLIGSVER
jgi:hypothetical protein